ncbi:hypothetical protein SSAG_03370 [Streptomyces sp. Mg1]|nr:hypothetical protein SSAG_03370 [Streptomyces sp. Mg1]
MALNVVPPCIFVVLTGAYEAEGIVQARVEHNNRFSRLHRIRLHRLWVMLHLAIALYGVALLCVCVLVA